MWHSIAQFFHRPTGQALAAVVIWQIAMTITGVQLAGGGLLAHTMVYDGVWYQDIILHHYLGMPPSPAFYPLFPLIISAGQFVTFGTIPLSIIGLVVNTVFLWLALCGLLIIAREFKIKHRYLVPLFFMLAPAAFFLHLFYTEPLFTMLSVWTYVFALRRQWLWVGILLALLTATRLPSILVIGLAGLEFLRAYKWNIRQALNPRILYFLLAPLGFIAYGTYLYVVRGNFLEMFSAYKLSDDWTYQVFNPNVFHTIARVTKATFMAIIGERPFDSDIFVNHFVPVITLALLIATSLYLLLRVRGKGIPLGVTGLMSVIMFSLNNNLVSVHRYILPCFGIYVALAIIYESKSRARPLIIALVAFMALLQIPLLYGLYTANLFAG